MIIDKEGLRLYSSEKNKIHAASIWKFSDDTKDELMHYELQELTIDSNDCIENFSVFKEIKTLLRLYIRYDYKKIIDISFVNDLPNLKDLGVPRFAGKITNKNIIELGYKWYKKSDISQCINVEKLDVHNCGDIESFMQQIADFPKLNKLFFSRMSANFFPKNKFCTPVKELEFSYCSKLEDISELSSNFPNVTHLKFDHCKNIQNYSPLAKLHNLQELVILDSALITDLAFLKELKNLSLLKVGKTKITAKNVEVLNEIPAKIDLLFTGLK